MVPHNSPESGSEPPGNITKKQRSPAAERALAEAAARRKVIDEAAKALPPENGGREGPDPVRYGDWEVKGLASDF
jgi:hypothetical protein